MSLGAPPRRPRNLKGKARAAPAIAGRRFLIFCDGTGEDASGGTRSNLARLAVSIAEQGLDGREQICFYQQGLGTGPALPNPATKLLQLGVGQGMQENITKIYLAFCPGAPPLSVGAPKYRSGDTFCFFGFSRGAATARFAADFFATVGLLTGQADEESVNTLFSAWLEPNYKPPALTTTPVKVECVGVFDTVQGLGVPPKVQSALRPSVAISHQPLSRKAEQLHLNIQFGFQALALHEMRNAFLPELWTSTTTLHQTIRQTWFIGKHSDVGGGPPTDQPDSGLANAALRWMVALISDNVRIGVAVRNEVLNQDLAIPIEDADKGQLRTQGTVSAIPMGGQSPRTPGRYALRQEAVHISVRNIRLLNVPQENLPEQPSLQSLIGQPRERGQNQFEWVNGSVTMSEDPLIAPAEGSAGTQERTAAIHPLPSASNPRGSVPQPLGGPPGPQPRQLRQSRQPPQGPSGSVGPAGPSH